MTKKTVELLIAIFAFATEVLAIIKKNCMGRKGVATREMSMEEYRMSRITTLFPIDKDLSYAPIIFIRSF